MTQAFQNIRRVSVTDVTSRDKLLGSAVESLIPGALELKHGIKVTRIQPGDYIVETTPEVPCGYTVCAPDASRA